MYYFIVNPNSRSGRGMKIWTIIKERLDDIKLEYKFFFTKHEGHAIDLASSICKTVSGHKDIVILGGDGTVNEVMNGLTDLQNVTLGYIPSGSSNDFARSLHISSNPLNALATVLVPPRETMVDIGELEVLDDNQKITSYRRFAVSSGIGFDASICYEALNSKIKNTLNRIKLGKLTYGLIAAKQIICYKPTSGDLKINGGPINHYNKLLLLVGMIHPFEGGGAKMAPQANYNDRKLSVCLAHSLARFKVLLLLPTAFIGKHTLIHGIETFDCDSLELLLDTAEITHTDGEYAGTNNHIRICCNRLSVNVSTPE